MVGDKDAMIRLAGNRGAWTEHGTDLEAVTSESSLGATIFDFALAEHATEKVGKIVVDQIEQKLKDKRITRKLLSQTVTEIYKLARACPGSSAIDTAHITHVKFMEQALKVEVEDWLLQASLVGKKLMCLLWWSRWHYWVIRR